jgi:hypothetical protein
MANQRARTIVDGHDVKFVDLGDGHALATSQQGSPTNTTVIGVVGSSDELIDVTLALDTSAYGSGDVLSDTAAIPGAVRTNGGKSTLVSITVNDEDDQKQGFDIILFRTNVSLGAKNSAPNISDADAREYLGHISIVSTDYIDLGGVSVARKIGSECALEVEAAAASQTIYVGTISRGTGTYSASGIRLKFGFLRS